MRKIGSPKNLKREESSVTVNIWLPDFEKDRFYGHVSLSIGCEYISFFPINENEGRKENARACISGVRGVFSDSMPEDCNKERGTPTSQFTIYGLNSSEMIKKYRKIKEGVENGKILWSLSSSVCSIGTTSSNCSKLTMDLLLEGGVGQRLPAEGEFGTCKHLILLCSSRVFITVSFLTCGLYPIMDDFIHTDNHMRSMLSAILITALNFPFIFILEKMDLGNKNRQLMEMNMNDDCIVGIGSSLGFGSIALLHRWLQKIKAPNTGLLLFPGTLLGLLLGGKFSSLLTNCFKCRFNDSGTVYTLSPTNIEKWMEYVTNDKNESAIKIKDIVYKVGYASILIPYSGWIGCYVARHSFFISDNKFLFSTGIPLDSGLGAFYLGLPMGFLTSYIAIKFYIFLMMKNEFSSFVANDNRNLPLDSSVDLFRHTLISTTTLLGIMSILSLFDYLSLGDYLIEKSIASPIGGIIGFTTGAKLYDKCRTICFGDPMYEASIDEISPIMEKKQDDESRNDGHTRMITPMYNMKYNSINTDVKQEKYSQRKCPCAIL